MSTEREARTDIHWVFYVLNLSDIFLWTQKRLLNIEQFESVVGRVWYIWKNIFKKRKIFVFFTLRGQNKKDKQLRLYSDMFVGIKQSASWLVDHGKTLFNIKSEAGDEHHMIIVGNKRWHHSKSMQYIRIDVDYKFTVYNNSIIQR